MVAMNKSSRSNIYIESPSENAASRDASRELKPGRSRRKPTVFELERRIKREKEIEK